MFTRAVVHIPIQEEQRMESLRQLQGLLEDGQRTLACARFNNLSQETKNLFFYVNDPLVREYENSLSGAVLRETILRECRQVIRYQKFVAAIRRIFSCCCPSGSSSSSSGGSLRPSNPSGGTQVEIPVPETHIPERHVPERHVEVYHPEARGRLTVDRLQEVLREVFGHVPVGGGHHVGFGHVERREPEPDPVQPDPVQIESPVNPIHLNITHTIAYQVENMPEAVQGKARRIRELVEKLEDLDPGPEVPNRFLCTINKGPMAIPLFDAGHGDDLEHNLDRRHYMDNEALEAYFVSLLNEGHDPSCPACRHRVDRDTLRIDTRMQDEILEWLEQNVPN